MTGRALVLDFGGPVLRTPFEMISAVERRLRLPVGTLSWAGPFDPAADPLWRAVEAGEVSEPDYWDARAQEFAAVTGHHGVRAMMAELYPFEDIPAALRAEARVTVASAAAAGLHTAVLTNDMSLFFSAGWAARASSMLQVEAFVDGSVTGTLKPRPAAYELILATLGVTAESALFVDDQPRNLAGARDIGMTVLHFDVTRPRASYAEVARLLGLGAPPIETSIAGPRSAPRNAGP